MFKPRLVASNNTQREPCDEAKRDAVIRRAIMLDSASGSMFGDVDDVRFDEIPACWPSEEK